MLQRPLRCDKYSRLSESKQISGEIKEGEEMNIRLFNIKKWGEIR